MVVRVFKKVLGSTVADWIIRVAVIVGLIISGASAYELQQDNACQGRYDNATNDRSRVLQQPLAVERQAERDEQHAAAELFLSPILLKPAEDRTPEEVAEIRKLYQDWRMALEKVEPAQQAADKARAENPIPPPISEFCG